MEFQQISMAQRAKLYLRMRQGLDLTDEEPVSAKDIGLDALCTCVVYCDEPETAMKLGSDIADVIAEANVPQVLLDVSGIADIFPASILRLALRLNGLRKVRTTKGIRWTSEESGRALGRDVAVLPADVFDPY